MPTVRGLLFRQLLSWWHLPGISKLLLTQLWPNFKGRFLGPTITDVNYHRDIYLGNISRGKHAKSLFVSAQIFLHVQQKNQLFFLVFLWGIFSNPSCFQNLSLKGIEKMAILANIFENLDFRIGKTVYLNFVGLLQFNRDRKSRMDKFWKNCNIPVEEDDSAPTIITIPPSPPIHTPPPKVANRVNWVLP